MAVLVIVGQVIFSTLAIFGLIFLFRAVFGWYFAPDVITVAVVIRSRKDADDLDILLSEAEKSIFRRRGVSTVVLISPELLHGEIGKDGALFPCYRRMVDDYCAEICILSENQQPSSV